MPIDSPTPPEARGETGRDDGNTENEHNYQVYFQEVLGEEERDVRRVVRKMAINLEGNMLSAFQKRSIESPEIVDELAGENLESSSEKAVAKNKEDILKGQSPLLDNRTVLKRVALHEDGKIKDPEIARAYIEDKIEEVRASMVEKRRKIVEAEKEMERSQVEVGKRNKLLEIARTDLCEKGERQIQITVAKEIIHELEDSVEEAEKALEKVEESVEKVSSLSQEAGSLEKEIDKLEKIKANIPDSQ